MKRSFVFISLFFFIPATLFAQQTNKKDTLSSKIDTRITVAEMMAKLPGLKGEQYALGMTHGTMDLLIYAPKEKDLQTPHDKDEVYIVVTGTGIFFDGKQRYTFKQGDVLFVPAKTEHRFENFSKDFVTWVVFYGKEGGEK